MKKIINLKSFILQEQMAINNEHTLSLFFLSAREARGFKILSIEEAENTWAMMRNFEVHAGTTGGKTKLIS